MVYSAVDPAIKAWARRHKLKVLQEFGGQERRFCYLTGGPQECFQISIEPPDGSGVLVNAWSIETVDDQELHESWFVRTEEVGSALKFAFDKVMAWKERQKGPATW